MGGDTMNSGLQASYLVCANNLRREAKLCDIILYVQGRMGAMVGYPAHKLLLISASKYFKLLFEREDLRNYCHFPHLSEEGVFAVLDIIYGREIRKETNLDDALMAARFLQVDCAIDELEKKKVSASNTKSNSDSSTSHNKSPMKRRRSNSGGSRPVKRQETTANSSQDSSYGSQDPQINKNTKIEDDEESNADESSMLDQDDSQLSNTENNTYTDDQQDDENEQPITVKLEPDVDLTEDGDSQPQSHDFSQEMYGSQSFGGMNLDNKTLQHSEGVYSPGGDTMQSASGSFPASNSGEEFGDLTIDSASGGGVESDDIDAMTDAIPSGNVYLEEAIPCPVCKKLFKYTSRLKQHMRCHSEVKPHVCTVCGKGFNLVGNLNQHMLIHTGTKQFHCDHCGKSFTQLSNLKGHIRTHGVFLNNTFSCEVCGKQFKKWQHWQVHRKAIHPNVAMGNKPGVTPLAPQPAVAAAGVGGQPTPTGMVVVKPGIQQPQPVPMMVLKPMSAQQFPAGTQMMMVIKPDGQTVGVPQPMVLKPAGQTMQAIPQSMVQTLVPTLTQPTTVQAVPQSADQPGLPSLILDPPKIEPLSDDEAQNN